eukprot:TRINITY_DN3709_c0_g1_i1.p1 TRINITY_DN3709_c0_g1~~TRINITY_DN3709_c0_g1_i1.p1  ORF type:complete len:952 (+),score=283.74 TRINITY_DN3709_c0_g1_i1:35-2890(+)
MDNQWIDQSSEIRYLIENDPRKLQVRDAPSFFDAVRKNTLPQPESYNTIALADLQLANIPGDIDWKFFPNLTSLDLSNNPPLHSLPDSIGLIEGLTEINLAGTSITQSNHLPKTFARLMGLKKFTADISRLSLGHVFQEIRSLHASDYSDVDFSSVPCVERCSFELPPIRSWIAGTEYQLILSLKNFDGNPIPSEAKICFPTAMLVLASPLQQIHPKIEVKASDPSCYRISWTFSRGGNWKMHLKCDSFRLKKTPIDFKVEDIEDNLVYRWGYGGGQTNEFTADPNPKTLDWKTEDGFEINSIIEIASGPNHSCYLSDNGKLYTNGTMSSGITILDPKLEKSLISRKISHVACYDQHFMCVDDTGDVFSGFTGSEPALVKGLSSERIINIAIGFECALALSVNGKVFMERYGKIRKLDSEKLNESFILKMDAYRRSMVFLSKDEIIFYSTDCGNTFSTLNLKKRKFRLKDENPKEVACGDGHFLTLTFSGKVFAWGRQDRGQTGKTFGRQTDAEAMLTEPCEIPIFQVEKNIQLENPPKKIQLEKSAKNLQVENSKEFIHAISCGAMHCAALTKEGVLYTWGDNRKGQLGHGDFQTRHIPKRVANITKPVYRISTSSSLSIAVTGISKTPLGILFLEILEKSEFKDVTFVDPAGSEIRAHRSILAARCPTMIEDLKNDRIEVTCPISIFKMFLEYLYSDRLPPTEDSVLKAVGELAEKFKLKRLSEISKGSVQLEKSTFVEQLGTLVNSPLFSDFQVEVEDGLDPIFAHKVLLNRCQYFQVLFSSGMQESQNGYIKLGIPNLETSTMLALMKWIYTDDLSEEPIDAIIGLIQVAEMFAPESNLVEICTSLILKGVDVDNVCYVWGIAKAASARELEMYCIDIMAQQWTEIRQSEYFLELPEDARIEMQDLVDHAIASRQRSMTSSNESQTDVSPSKERSEQKNGRRECRVM